MERGEATALHPEKQLKQHPPLPRGQHLHGRVTALRHGYLDVRHARPRRGAPLAAVAAADHVAVDVFDSRGGGVLSEREESGETLGPVVAVAAGGGGAASLCLQRLQVVLELLDEVDGASDNGRLVTLPKNARNADQLATIATFFFFFAFVTVTAAIASISSYGRTGVFHSDEITMILTCAQWKVTRSGATDGAARRTRRA